MGDDMLNDAELKNALHDGVRGAGVCGRFCTYGIRVDGEHYIVHHNGLSDRDSAWTSVYGPATLGLSREQLASKLKAWIGGLHGGQRVDLNAATAMQVETSGPAVAGWPWRRVVDHGTGIAYWIPEIPTPEAAS
jgi:hypothetical protein